MQTHPEGVQMHALMNRLAGADRRWLGLAVIVTAQFMVVLDVAIVNVALPTIKTDLHFSESSLQWVVTAYSILFGGMLLLGGRMADLLGRRRLFMAGLVLFTASSLARRPRLVGGIADRLPVAPGARGGAGLAGGALDPHCHVRGGPRAQQGARDLGSRLRQRRRCRSPAGRCAHELVQLVVGVLHQRPGRRPGALPEPTASVREPGRDAPGGTSTCPAPPRSRPGS